jgi:polysaccharide export outer membrane protein
MRPLAGSWILLSSLLLLLGGCATLFNKKETKTDDTQFRVTPPPRLIGPDDVLSITSFTNRLPSGDFIVDSDGAIMYPYIGKVVVTGKQVAEIIDVLIARLKDGYFRNPMLSVTLKSAQNQQFTMFGAVKNPMTYAYVPNITILEALAKAGGLGTNADSSEVTVMRRVNGQSLRMRVSIPDIIEGKTPNFFVLPGDIIIVRERAL